MAALTQRRHINLYQAEFRPARIVLPTQRLLLGAALFAVGLVALHVWDQAQLRSYRQQADRLTAQAERVERQLTRAAQAARPADPKVVAEAARFEARVRALDAAQQAVASGALGSETGYAAQFVALARASTPGAWLTRVELDAGGKEMNLAGRALHGEDPARLIDSLRRQALFAGLSYAALDVHPPLPEAPEPGAKPAAPAKAAPTYLEFSLNARLPEAAPAGQAVRAGGGGT